MEKLILINIDEQRVLVPFSRISKIVEKDADRCVARHNIDSFNGDAIIDKDGIVNRDLELDISMKKMVQFLNDNSKSVLDLTKKDVSITNMVK